MVELLAVLSALLLLAVIVLAVKVCLLRASAREIGEAFADRVATDTNTLITVSSRDRCMRRLAADINTQLRLLRRERQRYRSGDMELKEAVTNVSHDLRTPLTAICGYLELLKKEEMSPAGRKYAAVIENRALAMKELTGELFAYSLAAAAGERLRPERLCLNSALEESISACYAALKGRQIEPVIRMPEEKLFRSLDRAALSRIFANVLSNAVKYSAGDLEILLTPGGETHFSNTAPDLDELQVAKLFDRFYTVEDGRKSTGLGLSIARTLAEQMGGSVTAAYRHGRFTVTVSFPE